MRLIFFVSFLIVQACNSEEPNPISIPKTVISDTKIHDEIFKKKVIVILSKNLEESSNNINLQDYSKNGISFIPVFTSIEKFNASTKGKINNSKVEIEGLLLLSILNGSEILRVNPGLTDQNDFRAAELINKYSVEILKLNTDIKSKGKK